MKKTLLLLMTLCMAASCMGAVKHPSLLFTKERVEAARKALRTDTAMQAAWQGLLAEADAQAAREKADIRRLEFPALAYLMTGDEKYARCIRTALLAAAGDNSWADKEMMARERPWRSELQMAHRSFQVAVAYDAIYNALTPGERKAIADGMYRLAVEPLLGDWVMEPTRIHSLNSMGHNWWSSCVGMGGLLALAIGNENAGAAKAARAAVEAMPQWFAFAGDVIQHKPRTIDRDGGMYESINYASYGISEALLLLLAWHNAHQGEAMPRLDTLDDVAAFFCHVAYPVSGELQSINFGDSHKNVTGERSIVLAHALGHHNPETLWYCSHVRPGQHKEGMMRNTPMGFLYMPSLADAPADPGLPTSHLWADFGWATLRDSWQDNSTLLAVKSGMTWNHSHADANSFVVFHKGKDLIKDAGNCWYAHPQYRGYFFQSEAHNVVRFNGHGQPTYQQYHGTMLPGSVSGLVDAGRYKYVMADGTGPMARYLDRNFRHWLWVDNVIFVVDDLHSHEAGHFEWLWHPGGTAKKNGYALEIADGDAAVALQPLYPRPLAYSNFVHDYPDDMYWEVKTAPREDLTGDEEYYAIHLPATTDKVKALTAITLKDSAAQKELPLFERRQGHNWIGVRMHHSGKVTDLYINQLADGSLMHINSWINADGWDTDAYMFAVTYPEGTDPAASTDFFICHGSALRHGGEVYFSALTKLNLALGTKGGKRVLDVSGQPGVPFALRDGKKINQYTS